MCVLKVFSVLFFIFVSQAYVLHEETPTLEGGSKELQMQESTLLKPLQSRLAFGTPASIKDFPYYASLTTNEEPLYPYCGATIISARWVVTAAHCVQYENSGTLRVGSSNISKSRVVNYDKVIVHPNYRVVENMLHNDIALLRLTKPLRFGRYVRPVRLMDTGKLPMRIGIDYLGNSDEQYLGGHSDDDEKRVHIIDENYNYQNVMNNDNLHDNSETDKTKNYEDYYDYNMYDYYDLPIDSDSYESESKKRTNFIFNFLNLVNNGELSHKTDKGESNNEDNEDFSYNSISDKYNNKDNGNIHVLVSRGIKSNGEYLKRLATVNVSIMPASECFERYDHKLSPHIAKLFDRMNLCGVRVEDLIGTGLGDSGSPLVKNDTLVGIVSYGHLEGDQQHSRVAYYVNVASYVRWILTVIAQDESSDY